MPATKSRSSDTSEDTAPSRKKKSSSVNTDFDRHYLDYQLALHQIQADAKRSCGEAYDRMAREIHKAQVEAFLSGQEAYHNYLTLHEKSQRDPNEVPVAEVSQAYRDYVKVFETGQAETQKAITDAQQKCLDEVEKCQDDVHTKWREAFRDYVLNLQKSWGNVDPDTVNAATLAAMGHSIIAASCSAASEEQSVLPR